MSERERARQVERERAIPGRVVDRVVRHALEARGARHQQIEPAEGIDDAIDERATRGAFAQIRGERGGFAFARPDLFAGRPWIFTPNRDGESEALSRLDRFVSGLGARPSILSAEDHDRLMALVSHLPQLAASALMDIVGNGAQGEGLRMAGRGLVDTTRLASSPPDVWRDICLTNADAIGDALDCLIQRLTQLRGDLRRGDAVEAIFASAARWRAELMKDNH